MPSPRPPKARSERRSRPRRPRANVLPLEGWRVPMRCPRCRSQCLVQVDLVECVYPVSGVRRPWGLVELSVAARRVRVDAIAGQFYRCDRCAHEWPVASDTRFLGEKHEAPGGP